MDVDVGTIGALARSVCKFNALRRRALARKIDYGNITDALCRVMAAYACSLESFTVLSAMTICDGRFGNGNGADVPFLKAARNPGLIWCGKGGLARA